MYFICEGVRGQKHVNVKTHKHKHSKFAHCIFKTFFCARIQIQLTGPLGACWGKTVK